MTNQPTPAPTRKVTAGGLAGAVSILAVWGLGLAHVTVPPEVASALTVVLSVGTSYIVKNEG